MRFFERNNPMHNFSISKTYSATTINTAASTNTITSGSSQLGTLAGQHSRGSFVGLSTIVQTPESPLIPATYYQQDEPRLLPDKRLLSYINASQVDPFKALATHQTVAIEDRSQEQEQLGEFLLPFDELLLMVNEFDPMAGEDLNDVNLSTLPTTMMKESGTEQQSASPNKGSCRRLITTSGKRYREPYLRHY